ncbi:uncharacterized protein EV420DRAFT_1486009 [Desarmillaria tabescens]|uniref:Uncharacterized protein n=1 Tax=Armillaria tabescens TaxID=1929756 RepID=A0AA39JCE5_ARMTA|nr:uncharacterized protein EV420DRAFT_1486009 [Desarmillaria tabescens]KAK0440181.1 hypothetical protein EV420DRAFT_1486009 [Desarmillaria tabescens]
MEFLSTKFILPSHEAAILSQQTPALKKIKASIRSRNKRAWVSENTECFRSEGLHALRSENPWRPVITIEDGRSSNIHEVWLGFDRQNPDQKASGFQLYEENVCAITIEAWYQPVVRKSKKTLLGSATYSLVELDAEIHIELVPQHNNISADSASSPIIFLRLNPVTDSSPTHTLQLLPVPDIVHSLPPSPDPHHLSPNILGLSMTPSSGSGSGNNTPRGGYDDIFEPLLVSPSSSLLSPLTVPSPLPQYSDIDEPLPEFNFAERVVLSFTIYQELKCAKLEKDFEVAFGKQQEEWTYVAGLLLALVLIAVNTAVFATTPDSQFAVSSSARLTIAASATAFGFGLICDVWFISRYRFGPTSTLTQRSLDLFGTYFFFAFSARIPMICLLVSSVWLLVFLGIMACMVSVDVVLVVGVIVGLGMTVEVWVWGGVLVCEEGEVGVWGEVGDVRGCSFA